MDQDPSAGLPPRKKAPSRRKQKQQVRPCDTSEWGDWSPCSKECSAGSQVSKHTLHKFHSTHFKRVTVPATNQMFLKASSALYNFFYSKCPLTFDEPCNSFTAPHPSLPAPLLRGPPLQRGPDRQAGVLRTEPGLFPPLRRLGLRPHDGRQDPGEVVPGVRLVVRGSGLIQYFTMIGHRFRE